MTVQDALHQLKLEISENENRKDFSFSEKMKWAEELKKEYSKIAEQNMKGGVTLSPNGQKVNTRDKIAKDLDISNGTLARAEYIYNNAPEDLIEQLDNEQLSINKAYMTLKEQLRTEKEKANQLEQQLKQEQSKPPRVEVKNT
jgi:ParB family chromosome partitioning protein